MITMYGASWCPDCKRSKDFLESHNIEYNYVDIETSDEAVKKVESLNNGLRRIPTMVFDDGAVLVEPSNKQLAEKLAINI